MTVLGAALIRTVSTDGASVAADSRAEGREAARLREVRSAVETLKAVNTDKAESQKTAAREKVERLKARLRMLQMWPPVDPKAVAQLARELKGAVKSYAAAGGSAADLGGVSAGVQISPEAASADAPPAEADPAAQDASADGDTPRSDDPYRRLAEAAQARAARQSRTAGAVEADREFLREARDLARQLKALARRGDRDDAQAAADDLTREIEAADRSLAAAGFSVLA